MFKNFFSRLVSGYLETPAPQAAHAKPFGESIKSFDQIAQEMSGARPRPEKKAPARIHYAHPREKNDIPTELKFATYRDGVCYTKVAYAVFHGNRCVFTWADREGGSTIQNGEYIAQVIARRERRPLESLRFYDLQTAKGYGRSGMDGAGGMHFDEIILVRDDPHGIHIQSWIRTDCPEHVTELFKEYAAGSRPQDPSEAASKDF